MTDTDWQTANPLSRQRTWLGDAQPATIEHDDWMTLVDWGSDADAGLARLRARDATVDALFRVAEHDGLGITPVWVNDDDTAAHPLMEMALATHDTDWIMVCANDRWRASFTAEMIIDPLAPSRYDRHRTQTWTIYITGH